MTKKKPAKLVATQNKKKISEAAKSRSKASLITVNPAYAKWAKKTEKQFNLPPDPPLQPHLGQAREQKVKELKSKEKIERDIKRLASQGIKVKPELLRKAAERAASAPVEISDTPFMPLGVRGRYQLIRKGPHRIQIQQMIKNPGKDETPDDFQGKRTLRHEIEHAYDEDIGLAKKQEKLLKKLGAAGIHDHKHHKDDEKPDYFKPEKLFNIGHMRIGVMHMRDDVGKNFLDSGDLSKILKMKKDRKSRIYLERMIKQNPKMSLDSLAKLINQVAKTKPKKGNGYA